MNFNVDHMILQGGGTDFNVAFTAGLNIMKKTPNNEHVVTFFLSDGCAVYPTAGIAGVKAYMTQLEATGLKFVYASFCIGPDYPIF